MIDSPVTYRLGVAIFATPGKALATPLLENSKSMPLYNAMSVAKNVRHAWKQFSVN